MVSQLLDASSSSLIRVLDKNRKTAAHVAAPHLGVIRQLLSAAPDLIDAVDVSGRNVLHYTSKLEVVEYLLTIAPHLARVVDKEGNLPLHLVCRNTDDSTALLLLRYFPGALQVVNKNGAVPLEYAIIFGHLDTACCFLTKWCLMTFSSCSTTDCALANRV